MIIHSWGTVKDLRVTFKVSDCCNRLEGGCLRLRRTGVHCDLFG